MVQMIGWGELASPPSWSRALRRDFDDAAVNAGEEGEFGDGPFWGRVRAKLQLINCENQYLISQTVGEK
jgi:hypothetical protein